MKEINLYIEGMDCEEEVKVISSQIKRLRGVEDYRINLTTRSLSVFYDPSVLSQRDIIRTVERTGMKVSLRRHPTGYERAWWRDARIITLSVCGIFILSGLVMEHLFGLPHRLIVFVYGVAVVVGGYYPAKQGIMGLLSLSPNIRTLMVTGAIGAVWLGLWEEAAILILIYSIGDVLEAFAVDRVRGAVKGLMEIAPKEVHIKRDGRLETIPISDVKPGDTILIKPGERVPLDCLVLKGRSSVDQSSITGESIPVEKGPGDMVLGGSINQGGAFEARVLKPFEDTTLGRIIHYVREAETRKSRYQRFADTFGRYYTPSMFILSMGVMVLPSLVYGNWAEWFYRGLVVLVVSCSCGIALSIPVAVVASIANSARHGVLVKGGAHMEIASCIRAIAFDKTGSLTVGMPVVTDVIPLDAPSQRDLLLVTASIEAHSEHAIADAIVRSARKEGLRLKEVDGFTSLPGIGVTGRIDGRDYTLSSPAVLRKKGLLPAHMEETIDGLESEGKTITVLTEDETPVGIIAVRDEIRKEARDSIHALKSLGIDGFCILTGDNERVAGAISREAGIERYRAGLLPEDKVRAIRELKKEYGLVAMVGDGVNDAPSMVTADLGIAMGGAGTDVAIETGDVVLMSDDLMKIPYVIALSRKTVRVMKENIALSLLIVATLVPLALSGWIGLVPGLLINEMGGIAVILNGLRLLRERPPLERGSHHVPAEGHGRGLYHEGACGGNKNQTKGVL